MEQNRSDLKALSFDGRAYRVLALAPSGRYALAQDARYATNLRGPMGYSMYMDAPAVLFDIGGGKPARLGEAWCPFDALDGPFLYDVLWYEPQGFVKLCFGAIELSDFQNRRIYFDRRKRG